MLLPTREAVDERTWHSRYHHHYHFLADNGHKQFTASEAIRMNGKNPDYSKRNLWVAIEAEETRTPHRLQQRT
jgi:catalase